MPSSTNPPGPKGHFLLGSLPDLGKDLLGFFTSCARDYGDIVSFRLANRQAYLISHPTDIETVMTQPTGFVKHSFFWRHVRAIFGNGLLTSTGSLWLQERKVIKPAFHKDRLDGYGQTMTSLTAEAVGAWPKGTTIDIHEEMMKLTANIVATTLFGADVHQDLDEVGRALDQALREIRGRIRRPIVIPDAIPLPSNLRYKRAVAKLDDLVRSIMDQHDKKKETRDDLLTLLREARDVEGHRLPYQQIRDEIITLFLAGHETTAIALSWIWYLLSRHPDIESKLERELHDVLGGRLPSFADLPHLSFCEKIVREAMRLYPPVYVIGREATEDCLIGGYHIPRGATVFMSQWVVHHDPRFFPDPDSFMPDRWNAEFLESLPPYTFFPFGGGPRLCIGQAFAMMEATLLLATIAQRLRLILEPGHPVQVQHSMTLRPKFGMRMHLEPR